MLYASPDETIVENAIETMLCIGKDFDVRQQAGIIDYLKPALNSLKTICEKEKLIPLKDPKVIRYRLQPYFTATVASTLIL